MLWLTIEVATIIWSILSKGVIMLIAKTPKKMSDMLLERLPLEQIEAAVERRKRNGKNKPAADVEQAAPVSRG